MAENTNTQQAEKQQAQPAQQSQQGRPCPRDCRKCSWMQQVCCSSMMSFRMFDVMNGMMKRIDAQTDVITDLNARLARLEEKVNVMQDREELMSPSPGDLFHPAK